MSIEALPRHRAIDLLTLPKRCRSAPERRPIDWPISRMVETKSSAKPPRVSATRGMHEPTERQLGRSEASSYVGHTLGERGPGSVQLQTM